MKRRTLILALALMALVPLALAYTLSIAGSRTAPNNAAYILTFSRPLSTQLILNNRTANAVYFKLNDNATTPTASATSYDIALDQNETVLVGADLLSVHPVDKIGVFCADTTPTVRAVGW